MIPGFKISILEVVITMSNSLSMGTHSAGIVAIPILEISGLHVYYGESHAVQGIDLSLTHGVLSIVGRNGMGKTTLCNAILGLQMPRSGSIKVAGKELVGIPTHQISLSGVSYVPQGRRVWKSLSVDEHLRLAMRSQTNALWTVERIYDAFPRLAERRRNGGGQLSGGEQQMLAIGRALLGNPSLLVMDEPTEGLAPVIVDHVAEMLLEIRKEGRISILLVEQNIGVAAAVGDHVAIMTNGKISCVVAPDEIAHDRALQQRYLGVGRTSDV